MMGTKIKICGLMSERDINYANSLIPDFVGFVFVRGSRRYVSPDIAANLRMRLLTSVMTVGVFVNEKFENAINMTRQGVLDIVQLYGQEDDEYIISLKEITRKPVIKAFNVESIKDVDRAVDSPADFILLDNGTGGTGRTFDWTLVRNIERPFFLAGGLDPDNVEAAVSATNPYAVDVSSGVEKECVKDFEKMQNFINAVRKGRK
ncbi:MAG: phosphoribosylanthranilate isomerase [Synergistaceae bacterium]|nr:phosphoribosylanthranilate isomerase [Synergistaceae bacterium]